MNTFTKRVYKGYPFTVKATAPKYYDFNLTTKIFEDSVQNVELKPFDGISVLEENALITIEDGTLPDGSAFGGAIGYFGERGCSFLVNNQIVAGMIESFSPTQTGCRLSLHYNYGAKSVKFTADDEASGFVWLWTGEMSQTALATDCKINFTVSGEPTFDGHGVSFSSSGDYLTADKKLYADDYVVSESGGYEYECIAKVTTPASLSSYKQIARSSTANRYFGTYGTSWCLHDGSSRYVGGTVETNKTYWVKVVQSYDTAYKTTLYTLEDNGYSLTSLPTEGWIEQTSMAKEVFVSDNSFTLGTSNSYYWNGEIDLDNFVLKILVGSSYQTYWQPLGEYN